MKLFTTTVVLVSLMLALAGCARTTTSSVPQVGSRGTGSRPVGSGFKNPGQVAPCCRALAEGRIGLDQCMENPQCKANNRTCCMQAVQ